MPAVGARPQPKDAVSERVERLSHRNHLVVSAVDEIGRQAAALLDAEARPLSMHAATRRSDSSGRRARASAGSST